MLIGPLLIPHANWNADLARVAVGESTVLLVLGGVALFFTEQLRRDARAYHAALIQAQRSALLNEVSLRLAEHGLNPTRVLEIIVDAAHRLPQTDFALVMQFDTPDRQLRVAASTTEKHPVGNAVHGLELPTDRWRIHGAGAGYPTPLPAYFAHDGIRQVILLPLLLPGGDMLGVIGLGRQSDQPLSTHEQGFVQDLSAEAGLAIRNARLYAREQEQVERLHRFQELQTTYFSALAHEMKTPLTVLKTLAPSLRQLPDLPDETRREILDTIDGNLARLEWAINTPLESVRLEAGVITLHPRPLNLARAIRQVADRISPWLALKRQRVSIEANRNLPPVLADSSQIDQVISNLLVNAIKFAPVGSTISVTLHPADRTMQVWVEDEGPGVPPEERERIFDKFHSIAAAQTSGGAGLGLYICREVVQKHGGRIWVEDRPGGGCRFCFTLPLADEEDDAESQL